MLGYGLRGIFRLSDRVRAYPEEEEEEEGGMGGLVGGLEVVMMDVFPRWLR